MSDTPKTAAQFNASQTGAVEFAPPGSKLVIQLPENPRPVATQLAHIEDRADVAARNSAGNGLQLLDVQRKLDALLVALEATGNSLATELGELRLQQQIHTKAIDALIKGLNLMTDALTRKPRAGKGSAANEKTVQGKMEHARRAHA